MNVSKDYLSPVKLSKMQRYDHEYANEWAEGLRISSKKVFLAP